MPSPEAEKSNGESMEGGNEWTHEWATAESVCYRSASTSIILSVSTNVQYWETISKAISSSVIGVSIVLVQCAGLLGIRSVTILVGNHPIFSKLSTEVRRQTTIGKRK